jgi:O-antigen/teichoic acid export membrane protein
VAVSAAFILRSVWALVFGLLAGNLARCVVSYFIHSYRPHFTWDLTRAKELFGFGKWILGSSILVFLITQGDDIFVGKLLGVAALGFYQMAYRISNMPATEITHVISRVTFPAYSKIQDNLPRLRESYLRVLQLTAFLSFPVAGLIFVLAPDFTRIFLGEKWMPMVPAMMVLVFAGLIRSIGATTGPIFQAVGKPKIITKWQPVRLLVLVALIYPFTIQWGILGTSLAVFLSNLVSSTGFSLMVVRITKCEGRNFTKRIILPLISTLIAISFILVLKNGINMIGSLEFLLFVGVGTLVYLSATYIIDRQILLSIKEVLPIWGGK